MCGLAGIISPHASFIKEEKLKAMLQNLQHRGPDGEGIWINQNNTVALAHRRLSIIDLNTNANQPLHYLHYSIIFNGAIYNYVELKHELVTKGYQFNTKSDTEIICAAFDCWGKECVHHFDGMFAFAIYDAQKKEIFIARDRFGEKPLFYHAAYTERGKFDHFIFASEMKALWALGLPKQLNGTMVLNYLTLGYTNNFLKKTETFYTNILSLPAGHYLSVQPSAGKLQMKRWYELKNELRNTNDEIKNESDAIEKFQELFKTSISRRLRSDVKIGTSLSGGIDSSSIVAISQQFSSAHLSHECFTAVFPDFENDESIKSKQVADHFNLQQYTIEVTVDDWIKQWQTLTSYQEEPLQSSSVLSQFMLYRHAKSSGIKVILDGQGADEILGGYKKYSHWYLQQLLKTDLSIFKIEKKLLQQHHFLDKWNYKNYVAAFFPEQAAKQLQKRAVQQQNNQIFIQKEFLQQYQNKNSLQKPVIKSLEDILYFDVVHSSLTTLLRYADRNAMANSIEVRLPFLFHELAEFIFSLPSSFKIKDGYTKWILRKNIQNLLPDSITWQTNKIGYEPPQQKWMQHSQIQEMIQESKNLLVKKDVLSKEVLNQSIQPTAAHAVHNFDFRYLSAAAMFNP